MPMRTNQCDRCSSHIPAHVDRCPVCQNDVGYPNVRAAEAPPERAALDARLLAAEQDAIARGFEAVLAQFRARVRHSQAVICRGLGPLQAMVSSDKLLYVTFAQLVYAGSRLPEDNEFDRFRLVVDNHLFPYYHDQICFAALALDGRGLTSYGAYSVALKDSTIERRASVFEENSFNFYRQRSVETTRELPPGHRAPWPERDRLAAAKLHGELDPSTPVSDFAGILLKSNGETGTDSFIEVHVYGPIHRRGIERVQGPKPKHRADQAILADLRRKLKEIGLTVETHT